MYIILRYVSPVSVRKYLGGGPRALTKRSQSGWAGLFTCRPRSKVFGMVVRCRSRADFDTLHETIVNADRSMPLNLWEHMCNHTLHRYDEYSPVHIEHWSVISKMELRGVSVQIIPEVMALVSSTGTRWDILVPLCHSLLFRLARLGRWGMFCHFRYQLPASSIIFVWHYKYLVLSLSCKCIHYSQSRQHPLISCVRPPLLLFLPKIHFNLQIKTI